MMAQEILQEIDVASYDDLPSFYHEGGLSEGADFEEFLFGVLALELID
jgi:hypothetical protein